MKLLFNSISVSNRIIYYFFKVLLLSLLRVNKFIAKYTISGFK